MKTKTSILKSILLAAVLCMSTPIHAWERPEIRIRITLSLVDIQPYPLHPRGPVYVPEVGQTDHTLYFLDETDLILNIYSEDEDGELLLEYTTAVPATCESITLPADLSGTYVIEVVRADQHFQGTLEL